MCLSETIFFNTKCSIPNLNKRLIPADGKALSHITVVMPGAYNIIRQKNTNKIFFSH